MNYIEELQSNSDKYSVQKIQDKNSAYKILTFHADDATIIFDPLKELTHYDYQNTYYCTSESDLQTLVQFISNNPDIYQTNDNSEDVLDQEDTIRF